MSALPTNVAPPPPEAPPPEAPEAAGAAGGPPLPLEERVAARRRAMEAPDPFQEIDDALMRSMRRARFDAALRGEAVTFADPRMHPQYLDPERAAVPWLARRANERLRTGSRPDLLDRFDNATDKLTRGFIQAATGGARGLFDLSRTLNHEGAAAVEWFAQRIENPTLQKALRTTAMTGRLSSTFQYQLVRDFTNEIDRIAQEFLPGDPRQQGEFFWDAVPEGFGSMAAFLLAGYASAPAAVAMAAGLGVDEQRRRVQPFVEDGTISAEHADRLAAAGLVPGVVQVMAPLSILARFKMPANEALLRHQLRRWITDGAIGGANEFAVESIGAMMQNYLQAWYDDDREVLDDVLKQGQVGGWVGFWSAFMLSVFRSKGGRGSRAIAEPLTVDEVLVAFQALAEYSPQTPVMSPVKADAALDEAGRAGAPVIEPPAPLTAPPIDPVVDPGAAVGADATVDFSDLFTELDKLDPEFRAFALESLREAVETGIDPESGEALDPAMMQRAREILAAADPPQDAAPAEAPRAETAAVSDETIAAAETVQPAAEDAVPLGDRPVDQVPPGGQETGDGPPVAEAAPPQRIAGVGGVGGRLMLPDGRSFEVTYTAVEADSVIPSHDARRNFAVNERGDRNERPYHDPVQGRESRLRVQEYAERPNVALLTMDTPTAVDGPPVATPDGVVRGGNARSMAMQLAYARGGEAAAAIRQGMIEAAEKFGIDPGAVEAMSRPIIVRIVEAAEAMESGAISRELNEPHTAGRTASVDAVSRSMKISEETASLVARMMEPREDGETLSLRDVLRDPARSAELARALVRDGAWSNRDISTFTDPATHTLTEEGKLTIERMLFARLVNDASAFAAVMPAVQQRLMGAMPAIVRALESEHGPALRELLATAVEAHRQWRDSGQTLRDHFFDQASLTPVIGFGDRQTAALVHALDTITIKEARSRFNDLLDMLGVDPGGTERFGFVKAEAATDFETAIARLFPTPAELAERTTIADRLRGVEDAARARMRRRARPSARGRRGGARGGSAPIIGDMVDAAIIIAARAIRQGITAGERLRAMVQAYIKESAQHLADFSGMIERNAQRIIDASMKAGQFSQERFDRAWRAAFVQARLREAAMRPGAARAATRAFAVAAEAMRTELTILRARMIGQAREGAVQVQAAKTAVRQIVEANLPPQGAEFKPAARDYRAARARFLRDVENAKSYRDLRRVVQKLQHTAADVAYRDAVARWRGFIKRVRRRLGKLTNERRDRINVIESIADSIVFAEGTKTVQRADGTRYERRTRQRYAPRERWTMRDRLNELRAGIETIIAEHNAENKAIRADKARTRAEHIELVGARVRESAPLRPGVLGTFFSYQADNAESLAMRLENRWHGDGVITGFFDDMKLGEELHLSFQRDRINALDGHVRAIGFDSLAEASAKLAGTLGEASLERIEVVIGGQRLRIGLGEAAEIAAQDAQTLASIAEGSPIVQRRRTAIDAATGQRITTGIQAITIAEIDAIRQQVEARGLMPLVTAIKAELEAIRPDLFRALRRLKGGEPPIVEGYYPSRRDRDLSQSGGLSELQRGYTRQFSENAGLTHARTGGRQPFIIDDILTTYLNHLDNVGKIMFLAERVRDATGVLMSPDVADAIRERHGLGPGGQEGASPGQGAGAYDLLITHLIEHSLVNAHTATMMDRALRAINTNLAGTYLSLNPGTWMRQIAGLTKLAAHTGPDVFLEGVKNLRPGTIAEMTEWSGYFWKRMGSDHLARFSPVRSDVWAQLDAAAMQHSMLGFARAVKQLDIGGAYKGWQGTVRAIRVLAWFDAINGRIAWEGYKAKLSREHPMWTREQIMAETARLASNAVRKTQNSASPMDQTGWALQTQGRAIGFMNLFTSDALMSRQMIVQALHQSPRRAMYVASMVLANHVISGVGATGVRVGAGYGVAVLLAAAMGVEITDDAEERLRQRALHSMAWRTAKDVFGTVYYGDHLIAIIEAAWRPLAGESVLNPPVFQAVQGTAKSFTNLVQAGRAKYEGDDEKFARHVLKWLEELIENASALAGNPFLPGYWIARDAMRLMEDDREPQPVR